MEIKAKYLERRSKLNEDWDTRLPNEDRKLMFSGFYSVTLCAPSIVNT